MKHQNYAIMILLSLLVASCGNKTPNNPALTSGINKENMDLTVNPSEDFYQYACGGWMKNNPLKPEYARFGSFDQLAENNKEQLRDLITEIANTEHEMGSIKQKIGDFYNLGMDIQKINEQGNAPIQTALTSIANMKDKNDLTGKLVEMALSGSFPLIALFGEADPDDSKINMAWLYQSGIGIGDRDYYLEADMQNVRNEYAKMLTKMLAISGYSQIANFEGNETEMANKILAFETELATIFMDKEVTRDPQRMKNKMNLVEVQEILPFINVKNYMDGLGLSHIEVINVATLDYFKALNSVISKVEFPVLQAYLACDVIHGASSYLSDDFVNTSFDFYGKVLSGREELQERWKRVINTVDGALGEAVGQMYVEKYFPAESKERMLNLVNNLSEALGERIQTNTWMTDETKKEAMAKLGTFHVKIGYPDTWRDYSGLDIHKDSYYANVTRAQIFEMEYQLSKIGKPVDINEWLMTPQTVNAYYNPTTNEICFPAGILQPPFFDANADDAVNYGAIGVVIGHEMTHGFDDQGCQYDKVGNLNNWWTDEDTKVFDERKQVLVDWFDKIVVLNVDDKPMYANGNFTLGENIADNGGLNISYVALKNAMKKGEINGEMDSFTPEQRFFIAYAMVWAGNIRDAEIIRRTKTDPHSLGKWRVNGTLPHVAPFYEAFDIPENSEMYLAPEKRADIW
ncbi:M13 family metallopeptidase [Bacteroidales bacterium OttesenSCG-928-B11]|nr:M13 family metallopeptidase [Bacteroidales bacterium OttesenSCG-928-B11]MDL2326605.1 M13 family metallopeptidase [Bacteroidales bacterium OttesenSCG-928-A14]